MYSKQLLNMEESITLAITAKAKELKAQGKDVLSFSAGEPDFDTPKKVKDAAIKAINDGCSKYTPVAGTNEVLKAVCYKLKQDNNLDYSINEIITGTGAKQNLFNTISALINKDDEVLILAPYWVSYPEIAKYIGAKVKYVYPSNGLKVSASDIQKELSSKTKLLILNNPNNPSGEVYTKDELTQIAKILEGTNVFVISDEMYEKLIYDEEFCAFASLSEDALKRTITINGLSKCAAMPGWRFGYSASKDAKLNKLMKNLQGQCTSNICSITQAAAIPALMGEIDEDILKMKEEFKKRRDYAFKAINEIKGLAIHSLPKGAFYLFVDCSKISNDDVLFCEKLLEEKLVACVPGSGFGMKGYFRMSYATNMQNIQEGIARIKEFCESN